MTADETTCFKLLDQYSRTHHRCFLSEMFPTGSEYALCFRPSEAKKEYASRYECRYLRMGAPEVNAAARNGTLLPSTTEMLDRELSTLRRS